MEAVRARFMRVPKSVLKIVFLYPVNMPLVLSMSLYAKTENPLAKEISPLLRQVWIR